MGSQTVLPNDAKQTIKAVEVKEVMEKAEEKNVLTEEWGNVQNLVSFSKKCLHQTDTNSERSSDNEMKYVSENINALKTAITHGDPVTAQKVIITIITKITIMIEIIEYRIITIRKCTNVKEKEQLKKSIESDVRFINEHINILQDSVITSNILNEQLATLTNDALNKIEKQVLHIKTNYQAEDGQN